MNRNENVNVYAWMTNDLALKGTELLCFAAIYKYSQDGINSYRNSTKALAEFCGTDTRAVERAISSLEEKHIILKDSGIISNVIITEYRAIPDGLAQECQKAKIKADKSFKKPTKEEIQSYCKEKNYSIDADRFINYYESKGWKVGKTPMKNWKAAVSNWATNSFEKKDDLSYMNPDPVPNLRVGSFKDLEDYMNPDPVENLPIVNIEDL